MDKRDLYLKKISVQIDQYNAKLAVMRGKASEVHIDMKLEYLKQVEMLEANRDELKKKYEQLSKASESSWKDMKEGTENTWNELKKSVNKVLGNFK
jgi:hypothetical protein